MTRLVLSGICHLITGRISTTIESNGEWKLRGRVAAPFFSEYTGLLTLGRGPTKYFEKTYAADNDQVEADVLVNYVAFRRDSTIPNGTWR